MLLQSMTFTKYDFTINAIDFNIYKQWYSFNKDGVAIAVLLMTYLHTMTHYSEQNTQRALQLHTGR